MAEQDVIQQLKDAIAARGKFSIGNVADSALGIADQNKQQLQDLLNKFLEKKGLISADDEAALQNLLDKQKQERKTKAKIILRNAVIGIGTIALGVGFWYSIKKKK